MTFSCVEGFCGAGGMSIGLRSAGYDIRLAFDIDKFAVETYKAGVSSKCMIADISNLSSEIIFDCTDLGPGDLTVFSGGPPCQGFSKQRRGAHIFDDPRNSLIKEYARLANELKPIAFILENVAIFGQHRGRNLLKEFGEVMSDYRLYPNFYNAADYGVAQTRQRFVMVGIRNDIPTPFLKPLPTAKRWLTVGEAIGDLPEPPLDYTDHPNFCNHQRARVTQINIHRFSHVPQGGGWQDIPYPLRLPCHQSANTSSGGWPDVYGRLRWDGQCPTVTGGFDSFTRGRYGHPLYDRPLTPREAARLQGFPDNIHFKGTRQEVRRQIGNAVPPPLAEAIGAQIQKTIIADPEIYNRLEHLGGMQGTLNLTAAA
jgi:DNA (cytosine-5)-methyltransferase 1